MICRPVQFLYVERQASKYQLISYQDGGCWPGDSTRLDTMALVQWGTCGSVLQVCRQSASAVIATLGVNNLPIVVTWFQPGQELNPWPFDLESNCLPLHHQAKILFRCCYKLLKETHWYRFATTVCLQLVQPVVTALMLNLLASEEIILLQQEK